jgi:hypothetical protein
LGLFREASKQAGRIQVLPSSAVRYGRQAGGVTQGASTTYGHDEHGEGAWRRLRMYRLLVQARFLYVKLILATSVFNRVHDGHMSIRRSCLGSPCTASIHVNGSRQEPNVLPSTCTMGDARCLNNLEGVPFLTLVAQNAVGHSRPHLARKLASVDCNVAPKPNPRQSVEQTCHQEHMCHGPRGLFDAPRRCKADQQGRHE